MKIVLTGGTGMVGKNIFESAIAQKHELSAPGRSEMNLLDAASVECYLKNQMPDLVIHAAGHVGGIQSNMANKAQYLYLNLQMGLNLVHVCNSLGVPRILNLGSSCMYPKDLAGAIPESSLLGGILEPTNEGYAIAKIGVAKLCEYLSAESPNRAYKTLIPCNLYGRWDKFNPENSHLIPAIIRKMYEAAKNQKKQVEIWGSGEARREFMYAGDFTRYVDALIDKFGDLPSYLNVGLGYDYSINEYYAAAARVTGFNGTFLHNLDRPVGMQRKLVDSSRLKSILPSFDSTLEGGIRQTYEFFLEHIRN